ncbi:hypothetical protein [uncultured Bradyrhizobium sp.]|uniref:hypothetical protein n=1 Tax=uncultured Bradyrhizobium sp. TaxID=199684 RepID=UPI0035C95A54
MNAVVKVSKHLIPFERIALVEPFVMPEEPPFASTKDFKARILLLDKMSVLTEETPEALAEVNGFNMIMPDRVATSPAVQFGVEAFAPVENFQPSKPYQSRLTWRDADGNAQSKLLLADPDVVLAIAVRGEPAIAGQAPTTAGKQVRNKRPRTGRRRQFRKASAELT